MGNDALWIIVLLLVIIGFELGDISGKLKRCVALLGDCANSLDAMEPNTNGDDYP
jgi:hypothetical protein